MDGPLSEQEAKAWARLVRAGGALTAAVESELKRSGFPPIATFDALDALRAAEGGVLRPGDLETPTRLPQYQVSRLVDRLAKAGLAEKKPIAGDGRGIVVAITGQGAALAAAMETAYAEAVRRHFAERLGKGDAKALAKLLRKLI